MLKILIGLVILCLVGLVVGLCSEKEETEAEVVKNTDIENIIYLANSTNDEINDFVIDAISRYACQKLNVTSIEVEINRDLNCSGRYRNHIEIKANPSSIIGAIVKCEKNDKTTGSSINLCTLKEKVIGTILHEYRHHYQYLNNHQVFDNYLNAEEFGYDAYRNQECEADAFEFALQNKEEAFKFLMKEIENLK